MHQKLLEQNFIILLRDNRNLKKHKKEDKKKLRLNAII